MRVLIGPYSNDIIPVRRWELTYTTLRHKTIFREDHDYDRIDKVVYWTLDKLEDMARPLNNWSNRRKRKIDVHIDNYDVWNGDNTIALVVHPILIKLKEEKQGSPDIDNSDVPKHLRSPEHNIVNPETKFYETDEHFHDRWNWVLDEMIWAFEQCKCPDRGEHQFSHNSDQLAIRFEPIEGSTNSSLKFNYQKDPSKPAYWVDKKGKAAHNKRIQNGLRLFGKYYFSLWD